MTEFNDFVELTYRTRNRELFEDLLLGVTTPSERREIGRRIEIVKRLLTGQTHQEIASALHVGVATVTRGSRELGKGRFKVLGNKQ